MSAKKFDFFERESSAFEEVVQKVGLVRKSFEFNRWCRHPLCFICEATDDITNRMVDLEDGFPLGCIETDETTDALLGILSDDNRRAVAMGISDPKEKIGYLRAVVISQLSREAVEAFFANYDAIMNGSFEDDLYAHLDSVDKLEPIK